MKYFSVLLICVLFLSSCISFSRFERGHLLPSDDEPVEIPFEIEKGLIVLNAEVNGVSGRFLFDNGFSLSAISPEFADKVNIPFNKSTSLTDANSKKATVPETTVDTVNIKGQKFIGTGFYQIDTKNFWSCSELDGVIGASIINKINWNINFKDSTIKLSSVPFNQQGTGFDIAFSNNNSSFTDLIIQGKRIKTKIDFGKSGEIDLRMSHVENMFSGENVITGHGISSLSGNGLGNVETSYALLEPANIKVENGSLPLTGSVELSEKLKYEGYIGVGYFKQYNVIINSSEKRYYLSNPVVSDSSKKENSYGLTIFPIEDDWKIINVNPNDPDIQGIEVMDKVSHLDNEPIDRFADICEYRAYMKEKRDAGKDIQIRLSKNNEDFVVPYNSISAAPLK